MEGPTVVVCADGPALHVGARMAEACGDSMDVRAIMQQWECSEVQARQAFTLGMCKAVRVEVERGFATFQAATAGEHGLEWHYKLTPTRAVSATELLAADAAAVANINVLCRGHSTNAAAGLRPHVSGMALRLDGHTIDWAQPMRNHADPRVIAFPLFTNAAPLMTRWLPAGSDLRIVIYFSTAPPAIIRPTEHVRIIADAVYFDDAALVSVLASARSSRAPTVTRWTTSPQPIMFKCTDAATPEVVATGALDTLPGYIALGTKAMALAERGRGDASDEDASDEDASSAGSKGSKGNASASAESDSDDEYVIPRRLVTAMAAAGARMALDAPYVDAKPRTDIRPYLRPAAGGGSGGGGGGGGGAAAYAGLDASVGGGSARAASAPAPLLKFTSLHAPTSTPTPTPTQGASVFGGTGVHAPATPTETVPNTPFWWNDPKAAPTEEQELDTYAREHAETVAAMGALSAMSIDTYIRLVRTRARTCHALKSEATSHVTEWRTLVERANKDKDADKESAAHAGGDASGGDSASTNCDSAKLAASDGSGDSSGDGAVGAAAAVALVPEPATAGAHELTTAGVPTGSDAMVAAGTSSPVHSS